MKTFLLRSLLAGLLASAQPAGAWGLKAHQMQVRAVMRVLPAEMPAFFREPAEQLIFLGTEPDRWRAPENPSLTETTGPNHFFSYELALNPMPPNRHAFLVALAQTGKLTTAESSLKPFGLAPYAIQEWGEMLTGAFRRWRALPEKTPLDRIRKRQHEQSILFMAGVLAHWVTDVSQPMHCSMHILGWSPAAPNPHHYVTTRDIHARYETDFVERAISDRDVQEAFTAPPRELGDWLQESLDYIAACNSHVESIYRWDLQASFGSGKETAEAKPFTAARLAEGAAMLRDVWLACWRRSAR